MNERIRELYNQARNEVSIRDGILTPGELRDKFAELIIRECLRMCDVADMSLLEHNCVKEASGTQSAKDFIKEHFGVEELEDNSCPVCGEDGGTQCGSINCGY